MEQVARNLLDAADGFQRRKKYLILDRDPLYTRQFRAAMKRGGVEVLRLPPSSPNLNAYAERFVLSTSGSGLHRRSILHERCRDVLTLASVDGRARPERRRPGPGTISLP
jgi:putative transposase